MDPNLIGILGALGLIILVFTGFHIAIAMGIVAVVGSYFLVGPSAIMMYFTHISFSTAADYSFAVIPLFTVMGLIVYQGGLVDDMYEFLHITLIKLRGGLMIATMLAAGFFAACSGSSLAAAVTFSKISIPEMIKRKYSIDFACGGVAAVGTQSALIPPSALLIIYAIVAEQSVGRMLMAGILPGVLSNILYCIAVIVVARVIPSWVPYPDKNVNYTWAEKKKRVPWIWPLPTLMLLVLGVIYLGLCTPSEAAAFGASLSIVICIILTMLKSRYQSKEKITLYGAIRKNGIGNAFISSTSSTAMIFFILIGAMMFGRFIALSGVPVLLSEYIAGLEINRWLILIGFMLLWTLLGTFMSATAIIVIVMPVILPTINALEFNIIWFGILAAKLSEVAMITPPVGLNLFAVKGAIGTTATLGQIVRGTIPFLITDIVTIALLMLFPIITLLIPNAMTTVP